MPFILCLRPLFNLSNAVMCPLAGTSCIVFLFLLSLLFYFYFSFPKSIQHVRICGRFTTADNREVSLYVITYEYPYVVRAGERGQLSYVNLSTEFRRKALSYVGSSVSLFEIFLGIFRICPWQRSSRAKHKVHTPYTTCKIRWKTRFRFMVHAVHRWAHEANASPKQQRMFSSRGEIT